mgnify:FL=1
MKLIRPNQCIVYLLLSVFVFAQELELRVIKSIPFPEDTKLLDLNPNKLNWSINNSFLLLDEEKNQLFSLEPPDNLNLSPISGLESSIYGQLIWMGLAPDGFRVVDRLENEILFLDHRLNLIQRISIKPNLYPDMVAISHQGILYMYSQSYNSIFSFDRLKININPLIDFKRKRLESDCIIDMSTNHLGEIAVLNCQNKVMLFSQNGKLKSLFSILLPEPSHIVSIEDDWFLFNSQGKATSTKTMMQYSIPETSVPIIDIESMGKLIAILSSDHILILHAN